MRALPFVVLAACSEQEFHLENNPAPAGDLAIRGRVCDPVRRVWLEDALVYTHLYDDHDVVYSSASDHSDADGSFELTGLVGGKDYEIYTQIGHDIVDKRIVTLGSSDLALPTPACAGSVDLEVAVITGAYDDLTPLLDAIGFSAVEVVDGQVSSEIVDLLTDPGAMSAYDMIFFDGGHQEAGVFYGEGPVEEVRQNLRDYVASGGAVFASDWAYDVIEQTWPPRIDFFGDDLVPDAAQVGEVGQIVADVVDPDLSAAIDRRTVEVAYDMSVWPVVQAVDPSVTVRLRGDAPWRQGLDDGTLPTSPLLVGFSEGDGEVIFTTYRNSANFADDAMFRVLVTLLDLAPNGP